MRTIGEITFNSKEDFFIMQSALEGSPLMLSMVYNDFVDTYNVIFDNRLKIINKNLDKE